MTVFVKTLSDIVALFFQVLRFPVLIPSFIFVGLNVAFIWPQFQNTRIVRWIGTTPLDTYGGVIIGFAVLIGAFALGVFNTPIIRFFEGYAPFPASIGKVFTSWNQSYINRSEQFLLKNKNKEEFRRQVKAKEAELMWRYPRYERKRVLPTRLGNIIASAEEYPSHLYGIDSVSLWPFLTPILEKSGYAPYVENSKSLMDLLLNMSVITLFFGFEVIYADILLSQFTWQGFVLKMMITIGLAFVFYLFAIEGASSWGFTIRVAYVLHKDKLREKLGIKQPQSYLHEKALWRRASAFFTNRKWGDMRAEIELGGLVLEYQTTQASLSTSSEEEI